MLERGVLTKSSYVKRERYLTNFLNELGVDADLKEIHKYLWEIFATLHYSEAANIIKNERKKRYEEEAKEKSKEITIDKEILNQIQGSLYFSKKNGRALFKINPKDYDQPNRKRKLQEIENSESKIEESPFNIPKALIKRSKKDDDQDLESQRFVSLGKMTKLNKH